MLPVSVRVRGADYGEQDFQFEVVRGSPLTALLVGTAVANGSAFAARLEVSPQHRKARRAHRVVCRHRSFQLAAVHQASFLSFGFSL